MTTKTTSNLVFAHQACGRSIEPDHGGYVASTDENDWVAIMDTTGQPIYDMVVYKTDTGESNTYQDLPEGFDDWSDLASLDGFQAEISACQAAIIDREQEAWREWLWDNNLVAYRVYPRDFANEFDLVIQRADTAEPEGDANQIPHELTAEILEGSWGTFYGETVWPSL